MQTFLAFIILLNAAAMIVAGYLLWNLDKIFDRKLSEAIRKQDDRLRKRQGSSLNGKSEESQEAPPSPQSGHEQADQAAGARQRRQTGRPFRR